MTDEHPLGRFTGSETVECAEWLRALDEAEFGRVCGALLAMGFAVRVSAVGYGRALRLGVTDSRGWATGWTVGSLSEMQGLCRGLLAEGAQAYVERSLEKPRARR